MNFDHRIDPMTWKQRYQAAKGKMLTDSAICIANRKVFDRFFDYEQRKLLHINDLSQHDEACFKTLYDYVVRLKTVNRWFGNKPWAELDLGDIKRVYESVRDGSILNRRGTPHKDLRSYVNKILRGKPFQLAGKAHLARKAIEFAPRCRVSMSFLDESGFKRLASIVSKPAHRLLLWLAWDFGENVSTLLQLRKSDFKRRFNPDIQTHDYLLTYRPDSLKRSRLARTDPSLYDETSQLLDLALEPLNSDDRLFSFGYRQALKVIQRSARMAKVITRPFGGPVRWRDFRSGMACHLLGAGWSKEAVNVRLGHRPHSTVLDPYLSHLVIDHDREKRKLHEHIKAGVNVALERARLTVSEYEQERRMFRKDIVAIQADLAELRQIVAQLSPLSRAPTHAIPSAQAYQANE